MSVYDKAKWWSLAGAPTELKPPFLSVSYQFANIDGVTLLCDNPLSV